MTKRNEHDPTSPSGFRLHSCQLVILFAAAACFALNGCSIGNDDTGEVTAPTDDVPYDGSCDDWWEEVAEYTCRSNIICDNGCWCTILHSCFDGNEGGDYIYEKECGCDEL